MMVSKTVLRVFASPLMGEFLVPNALIISCKLGVLPIVELIQLPIPSGGIVPQLPETISHRVQ